MAKPTRLARSGLGDVSHSKADQEDARASGIKLLPLPNVRRVGFAILALPHLVGQLSLGLNDNSGA